MNAILRACSRVDSVYFGSFCIPAAPHIPATCSRYVRDQEMFADAYQGELFDET